MTTQPEALRLVDRLTMSDYYEFDAALHCPEAAAELRRLHEAHEWQYTMAGERLRRIEKLEAANQELLEALSDVAYGLEKSRIWGGMDWSYHPLHPVKYLPLRDKARAAIEKHGKNK